MTYANLLGMFELIFILILICKIVLGESDLTESEEMCGIKQCKLRLISLSWVAGS